MSSQTTRIDFYRINTNAQKPPEPGSGCAPIHWGYMVRFFCQGWDYFTTPYRVEIDPEMRNEDGSVTPFDLEKTLQKLEAAGWTVRRWRAGGAGVSARAWRGPATPVRTREEILRMRRRQSRRLAESASAAADGGSTEPEFTTFIDYAYEG